MFPPRPAIPGINYAHPACRNLFFCGIAIAGTGTGGGTTTGLNFYDFYRKQPAIKTAAGNSLAFSQGIVSPIIGLAHLPSFSSATDAWGLFQNNSTSAAMLSPITIGAIINIPSLSVHYDICQIGSTNSVALGLSSWSSDGYEVYINGARITGSTAYSKFTGPAFLAGSLFPNGTFNWLIENLTSGAVITQTATGISVPSAPDGNIFIAGISSNATYVAALVAANVGLPLTSLVQWAADPWRPWRPSPISDAVLFSQPAAGDTLMGQAWF
jgi:hypothetical protein